MIFNNSNEPFKVTDINSNYEINPELIFKVKKSKQLIDNNEQIWETNKYKLNQYEYIYKSSKYYTNISSIIPISRSFFKLIEIIYEHNLLNNQNINTFSIAEGPGGFIECILFYLKEKNIEYNNCYGITLISNDNKIPYWNIKY